MEISVAGCLVILTLLVLGRLVGSSLLVGTTASLAFGSTAIVTLSAVGGASPLISVGFAALLCAFAARDPGARSRAVASFDVSWVPWVLCAFAVYAVGSAVILPRLFAGRTNIFVASRDIGVTEVALVPGNGNVTQLGYFILGTVTCLALLGMLLSSGRFGLLRRALLTWAALDALGGLLDLAFKIAGAGDVLAPIRTASYALLTDDQHGGFARIAGTYSEASAFATASLPALAFAFTDWRRTGARFSGVLAVILVVLLVLSTSSTAYAGLAVLAPLMGAVLARATVLGRLTRQDALFAVLLLLGVALVILAVIANPHALGPVGDLFQAAVVDKMQSESGRERSHWNERSLMSVLDTGGLGIGFGSSRASNWVIAVVSQLGVLGSLLQAALLVPMVQSLPAAPAGHPAAALSDLNASLRACMFGGVLGSTISGATADPGLLFFVALAGITATRITVLQGEHGAVSRDRAPEGRAPMTPLAGT